MKISFIALAVFLLLMPVVSQAAIVDTQNVNCSIAKVKCQVKREVGTVNSYALTATTKTITKDTLNTGTNASIVMYITDVIEDGISGTFNVVGKNNLGGLYIEFSGSFLPFKSTGNMQLGQEAVTKGYLLLTDGVTYDPALGDNGFGGVVGGEVVEFSGTIDVTLVGKKNAQGNPVGSFSFNVYPDSAVIKTVAPDGTLSGSGTPAMITVTIPPAKFGN